MINCVFIEPEKLPDFFKKQLANPKSVFIFSTDVVMNSWIDWCVTHPQESGVEAVPLERFTAWDKFKSQFIKAKEEGKTSIPSVLRKFFVDSLITENKTSGGKLFKKIINPEFSDSAETFTGWIAKSLPSLQLWQNRIAANPDYILDDEDEDYNYLYRRYSEFLEKNQLFEPSWIQPDFSSDGNNYIIFYPEILEDYSDYIEVFADCPSITLVSLPETEKGLQSYKTVPCHKFSDSRKELRRTILQIRRLVNEKKAVWNEITLNVPDLETYRPYLERELEKYCVPFVIRAGFPLTKNCAGQIFTEIQKCNSSNFSYDSVRSLLLDEYIPWKTEFAELRENLIREGNRLRCLCSFTEAANGNSFHFDSWEKALGAVKEDFRELEFYRNLKKDISTLCEAATFAGIHSAWIIFRDKYLEKTDFSQEANNIISRCVTELNKLKEIEEAFCTPENPQLTIQNHFGFFMNELSGKTYTPQSGQTGISVYPYRLSAAASFKYQFVIDSSQKNVEIQYKRLGFLNSEKRRALGLENDDKKYNASKAFIRLYAKQSDKSVIQFSYAENSFAGFAISHNALEVTKNEAGKEIENPLEELDEQDFILAEKNLLLGKRDFDSHNGVKLSQAQKSQLRYWIFFNSKDEEEKYSECSVLREKIEEVLVKNRNKTDGKIVITQSDMKNFFPCPRKWIFSNVIKLKEDSLDTDLMQIYDMGNINHKILELFMKNYLNSGEPLPVTNKEGAFDDEVEIAEIVRGIAAAVISDNSQEYALSPLTNKMLSNQLEDIVLTIMNFLHTFCQKNVPPEKISSKSKTCGYGGCFVRGVEKGYDAENEESGFNYYGKIDLLLSSSKENEALGWTIIDYKNSKIPSNKAIQLDENGRLEDFQMPMYITLVQKNEKVQDIDVARFYSIKSAETHCAVDINTKDSDLAAFEPEIKTFEKYAGTFAEDVSDGNLAPDSQKVDVYNDCAKCNFKSVCRFNYVVSGRKM